MSPEQIAGVGAIVGGLAKVAVAGGLRGRWATVAAFVVTALVVWVFSLAGGGIHAANASSYLAAYSDVLGLAAGAFHVIENVPPATRAVDKLVGNSP
jgi:hypothetical protein